MSETDAAAVAVAGTGADANTPPYAKRAFDLMQPEWNELGNNIDSDTLTIDDVVEDITALLLVRLCGVVAPLGTYPDLSIHSICKNVLQKQRDWPLEVTDTVLAQLKEYVSRIIKGYKDVPYHNYQHAHHVVLSTCKLLDLVCYSASAERRYNRSSDAATPGGGGLMGRGPSQPPSYGLRNDPMLLFVQVFAALIHDVEHQGLANRQLASEKDRLAVLYNDQSIAENWSLYIAFSEFLQDEFQDLRKVLFECNMDPGATPDSNYLAFRKAVINLVLCTDIASPERTQIGKSKWKEAFGDPYETVERKIRAEQTGMRRRSLLTGREFNVPNIQPSRSPRRGTAQTGYYSEITSDGMPMMPGDEDSLSGTPEGSDRGPNDESETNEDEMRDAFGSGTMLDHVQAKGGNAAAAANNDAAMLSPMGNKSVESGESGDKPLYGNTQHSASTSSGDALAALTSSGGGGKMPAMRMNKWERRLSSASRATNVSSRYKQRLGILRTVDLSGETIENYSHSGTGGGGSRYYGSGTASVISGDHAYTVDLDLDEPDQLKVEVLMESIMTAADVAHNLQGWKQMTKWSNKLYLELRKAYIAKRGFDAQPKWFENQIGFLESYLLPLAHRLEDTGVFPANLEFAKIVEDNRDRWLTEGYDVAQEIIQHGAIAYPEASN